MAANELQSLSETRPMTLPLPAPSFAMVPQSYVNPGLSLAQLFAIVWAHRKRSLLIALSIVVLAGAVSKMLPKTYSASASLMVNYEINDPLGGREFPIGLLGSYMSTQVALMQSSEVLQPVVDRLGLTENPKYAAGHRGGEETLREWVERKLSKNLSIEQGRFGSQLIYITYTAGDPVEAAAVANAVAEVYSEQVYNRLTGPAADRAKRYTEQLDELKAKVGRAQEQVTEFRQRTGFDADAKTNVDLALLGTLEQRRLEAQNARRAAEARLAMNPAVANDALSSNLIQSLKTQLSAQQAHMAELRATLGPRHPQVVELQSQIDATQRSLEAEMRVYSSTAASELRAARDLEQKLDAAVEDQRAKTLDARTLQDQAAKYELELESAQSVYKRALDGYDQIMFASSGHYTNVSFVSRATPPLKASKPKTIVNVLLGAVLGGFLGVVGPLAYDLFNRRVRCRDDLERDLGMPVLLELESIDAGPRRGGRSLA
jgi:uncharacterized protein involved in exopolysaccharide biosynthesis